MAISLDLLHHITDDELVHLSERNPGYQFERTTQGRLVVSPTGGESGRLSMEVAGQLHAWNTRIKLGMVFDSSTGFNLPDGSCLSPDASWLRSERWEALSPADREGFPPLCPNAVFEVRSPSNTRSELRAKMQTYIENGAQVAVYIDPKTHRVEVYRPGQEPDRYEDAPRISFDPDLPEFFLNLDPIFRR